MLLHRKPLVAPRGLCYNHPALAGFPDLKRARAVFPPAYLSRFFDVPFSGPSGIEKGFTLAVKRKSGGTT